MPVLKSYRHGLTGGIPPMKNDHLRAKRGEVEGWSVGATRRNTAFLRSIREDLLTGAGIAFTLTLKDCPPTARDWHRIRRAWEKRMVRAGMVRLHWVTEWQRRGVPHLHGAIWFPDCYDALTVIDAWMAVAAEYGAGRRGQHWRIIDGPVGWFQYLSKHAARGVKHYQRSADNLPEGWQKRTGRVWGKSGDWPEAPVVEYRIDNGAWFVFRRLVRAWRKADARESGDRYRIRTARSMLTCHDRPTSEVRGVSEWLPSREMQDRLIELLAAMGHEVRC